MIKFTKEKTEMREGTPIKIFTIEIDLHEVQQESKDMTLDQLKVVFGEKFTSKLSSIVKCKQ